MKGIMPSVCKQCSKAYLLKVILVGVTLKYAKTLISFSTNSTFIKLANDSFTFLSDYIQLNPIPKMGTVWSSKMLVTNHVPAWYHIPKNHNLNIYCSDNLKSKSAIYLVWSDV